VCQLSSVSKYKLQLEVAGRPVEAIVDTAAEVTIISEEVFRSLPKRPDVVRKVKLLTAGKQQSIQGFIVGPVKLKIGSRVYKETIYVAPIAQDMLLGFDLLHTKAVLDMRRGVINFDGEEIGLNMDQSDGKPLVARVAIAKRRVVPPNTVMKIKCKVNRDMPEFLVEPDEGLKVLVPRSVHSKGKEAVLCVMNVTDKFRLLKKGTPVATAYPVDDVLQEESLVEVPSVNTVEAGEVKGELPDHLQDVYTRSIEHLDTHQQEQLKQVLNNFQEAFATNEFDLGHFTEIEQSIDTGDAKPVKQRMRRTPACFAGEEEAHLKKMLEAGVIQESTSEWASVPVLIRKRDGSVRWCVDYRALNHVTLKDKFPLPLLDDCLDTLAGNFWFSKLDANSAYWQINIKESDRHKTAFVTKYGLFEHVKMGFGLCNSPACFSRVVNLVLRGLNWKIVLAFLDDILVLGNTFESHLQNLVEVLERFKKYGLKLKPKKCVFFQHEVEFLGRNVSNDSLEMADKDIEVVVNWPVPKCYKDVERFMGLSNYHRSFIKDFAAVSKPLYDVAGKNKFRWGDDQQTAFDELKRALTSPPVLALPNHSDEFILDTDASNVAVGAELSQLQNGEEKVIAYGSYALTPEQRNYCVTRRELLAVVRFTRQYRYYLLGRPFTLRTDHSSLIWLLNFKDPQGQLARWMEELSQYDILLKHRPGKKHENADPLSRVTEEELCRYFEVGVRVEDLPCKGCRYCKKADEQWGRFTTEVDEAVPLVYTGARRVGIAGESTRGDKDGTMGVSQCREGDCSAVPDLSKEVGSHAAVHTNAAPRSNKGEVDGDCRMVLLDQINSIGGSPRECRRAQWRMGLPEPMVGV